MSLCRSRAGLFLLAIAGVAFLWLGHAGAKSPPFQPVGKADRASLAETFLWTVKGPKAKGESFLLGTVHVGVAASEMPKSVWRALRASEIFVSEADTSTIDAAKIEQYLYYKPPASLTKKLGKKRAEVVANALGSSRDSIGRMRPWFASSLLVLQLEPNSAVVLDRELQEAAAKLEMRPVYLETYEGQLKMLAGLDEKQMLESLYELASDMKKAKQDYQQLTAIYRSGDAEKLNAFLRKEMARVAGMEQKLLSERNKNWVPKLTSLFKSGPTFVAVGAAHLVGTDSVVELLRKEGYQVQRSLSKK